MSVKNRARQLLLLLVLMLSTASCDRFSPTIAATVAIDGRPHIIVIPCRDREVISVTLWKQTGPGVDDEDWTTVWEAAALKQPDETGIPLGIDSALAQADGGYETYHFEPGTRYRVATSTSTGGRGLESFLPRDLRPGMVQYAAEWMTASEFYSRTRYC